MRSQDLLNVSPSSLLKQEPYGNSGRVRLESVDFDTFVRNDSTRFEPSVRLNPVKSLSSEMLVLSPADLLYSACALFCSGLRSRI
jgi:hypothetical protein